MKIGDYKIGSSLRLKSGCNFELFNININIFWWWFLRGGRNRGGHNKGGLMRNGFIRRGFNTGNLNRVGLMRNGVNRSAFNSKVVIVRWSSTVKC